MTHQWKPPHRAVITGMGVITPLGSNLEELWTALLAGRSGIRRISHFEASELPSQIAGEVTDFNGANFMPAKEARRMARASQFALAASQMAIEDAGLELPLDQTDRVAVSLGTAIGGMDRAIEGLEDFSSNGFNRINPFTIPSAIPNMPAFHIAERFSAHGPNMTITTACAAGTQAVGEGADWVRYGKADVVLACGSEAMLKDYVMAGFASMRALPTSYNDSPEEASRPFEKSREGFAFSEGAACLVIENLDVANARGARIYAELMGHASSSDAYHMAAPDPSGDGAVRTMQWALEDAHMNADQIDYINAHGTSTPANDLVETQAIKRLFKGHAYEIPISSTKSMIGHPMGASGAIEAVVTALTIHHGWIHPTINYVEPDPECDLDYVPNQPRESLVRRALSNSFGLGGQNACLILGRLER